MTHNSKHIDWDPDSESPEEWDKFIDYLERIGDPDAELARKYRPAAEKALSGQSERDSGEKG